MRRTSVKDILALKSCSSWLPKQTGRLGRYLAKEVPEIWVEAMAGYVLAYSVAGTIGYLPGDR